MNLLIQMKKMKSLKLIYKILSFIKKLLTQLEYKYSIKYKNVIKNKDFIFQIFIYYKLNEEKVIEINEKRGDKKSKIVNDQIIIKKLNQIKSKYLIIYF